LVAVKVVSVNVGLPRKADWKGRRTTTGIYKSPVEGRVAVRTLNLDGDRQADLRVHGGPDKAVYAYPSEHYAWWRAQLDRVELPWGAFGENLTIEGLTENDVCIGDRFRAGTAEFVVTQPRMPCYKLGIRFGRTDVVEKFLASGRTGFYVSVVREGDVGPGDPIEWTSRDPHRVRVLDLSGVYTGTTRDPEVLRRAAVVEALPAGWRRHVIRLAAGIQEQP
jgi:MOSC domain-containing protein YiiM